MAIIRFNPYVNQSFLRPFFEDEDWLQMNANDGLNVFEENNSIFVEAAVPGVPEDKIDITYEDGVLTVKAQAQEKEEEKRKNRIVHRMQRVSSFNYTTYLPRPIDEKKIEATVDNGILTVKAPVAEAAKPKRIPVRATSKK